jgi:hypothetical protein
MQFVEGKPPETQYATRQGARAKRREVALGRPGFEPGRIARMAEFKAIPRPLTQLARPPGSCPHSQKDTNPRRWILSLQAPREQANATVAQRSPLNAPQRPICTPSCNPRQPYCRLPFITITPGYATILRFPSLRGSPPATCPPCA